MTTHEERDLLLDLAYGELSERDARRLREHVAGCVECRAELERIEGTRRVMSALPELPAPARGERILLAAAREQAERARPRWSLPRWLVPSVALAATVTAVTVVTLRTGKEAVAPREEEPRAAFTQAAPPPGAAPTGEARPPEAAPPPAFSEKKELGAPRYAQAPPPRAAAPAKPGRADAPEAERSASRDEFAKAAPEPRPAFDSGEDQEGLAGGAAAPPAAATVQAPAGSAVPAEASGAARAERKASRPSAAGPVATDADAEQAIVAREAVAGAVQDVPVVRNFPGCPGELRREIRRDDQGRVTRYVRDGLVNGRRVRVELEFGPDGSLASARGRDVESGTPVPPDALPGLPRAAGQVDPDAPPRCGP